MPNSVRLILFSSEFGLFCQIFFHLYVLEIFHVFLASWTFVSHLKSLLVYHVSYVSYLTFCETYACDLICDDGNGGDDGFSQNLMNKMMKMNHGACDDACGAFDRGFEIYDDDAHHFCVYALYQHC